MTPEHLDTLFNLAVVCFFMLYFVGVVGGVVGIIIWWERRNSKS